MLFPGGKSPDRALR